VREKLIDAQTPGYQAEFDPEEAERAGAFVEEALGEQPAANGRDELAAILASDKPSHIRTKSARTIFGLKPGETLAEGIERKKREEAERAGTLVEDALSEQAAAESSDDQTQAFITEGETL